MRNIDFSSWQGLLVTLGGLVLVTAIGVGIRLIMMLTIQQRRERANRQINERLKTLIAAYKTLGGSFTGNLAVDPSHLRDIRQRERAAEEATALPAEIAQGGSERARRIRDAVEAALSDIILLGTEEHVRLARDAARELVAGHAVHTHDLVVSLRNFIREALDLDPIPAGLELPAQGPARQPASGGGSSRSRDQGDGSGKGSGAGAGMGMGMGAGMGAGLGMGGLGAATLDEDEDAHHR
ncbi:hypothetical protein [Aestuariivirga sp.]|uniref:hypothetical protein n=1 Tax=Aestuariivirga sp. TaxID=2650926 RepID=UPI0039E61B78